jgi:hypothetical protein
MFLHGLFEFDTWEQLQQLREDARKSLHGWASLDFVEFAKSNLIQERIDRALLFAASSGLADFLYPS